MSKGYCPYCSTMVHRLVVQTNFVPADEATYRRNRCPECGQNYMSIEVNYDGEKNKTNWSAHWTMGDTDEG